MLPETTIAIIACLAFFGTFAAVLGGAHWYSREAVTAHRRTNNS